MSDHYVTVDWSGGYGESLSMTCEAPLESTCHAVFACECDQWSRDGIEDGAPWHAHDDDLPHVRHVGTFSADACTWRDWFDSSEEVMRGAIVFRVDGEWHDDHMTFKPSGAVKA